MTDFSNLFAQAGVAEGDGPPQVPIERDADGNPTWQDLPGMPGWSVKADFEGQGGFQVRSESGRLTYQHRYMDGDKVAPAEDLAKELAGMNRVLRGESIALASMALEAFIGAAKQRFGGSDDGGN